jgi:hypothetical protein
MFTVEVRFDQCVVGLPETLTFCVSSSGTRMAVSMRLPVDAETKGFSDR